MKTRTHFIALVLAFGAMALAASSGALAQDAAVKDSSTEATVASEATDELEGVKQRLLEQIPGMPVNSIAETAIAGLYEIIADGQVYYIDESAEYLLDGSMINLSTRENLTEARLAGIHTEVLAGLDEENMLVYHPAEGDTGRSITVFTDITCGYCRKLHSEIEDILSAGISVRYLLFPRAGLGSQAHKDLVSVWCADDPQTAMTDAKAGKPITPLECENPVEEHVALARQLGLEGTPLIYLDTGERVPGYRPAASLVNAVEQGQPIM